MKIFLKPAALNQKLVQLADQKIVFTNGVFDLIHPGHIDILQFAKQSGDFLIVGINDDSSVRRLKGSQRPFFTLNDRVRVLAALRYVDFIIPFSEDTPLELINSLCKIDVLVKGADYKPGDVVGYREITARGGSVCLFQKKNSYSSTQLINWIQNSSRL